MIGHGAGTLVTTGTERTARSPAGQSNIETEISRRKHRGARRRRRGYQVALATYRAACERWPDTPITLRQSAWVIEDGRRTRAARRRTLSRVPLWGGLWVGWGSYFLSC